MIIPVRLITIMGSETMFGVPYEKITASLKFKHFRKGSSRFMLSAMQCDHMHFSELISHVCETLYHGHSCVIYYYSSPASSKAANTNCNGSSNKSSSPHNARGLAYTVPCSFGSWKFRLLEGYC
jgi:hypothetical protein